MNFDLARKQLNSGRRMSRREYEYMASFVNRGITIDIGAWMGFSSLNLYNALKKIDDGTSFIIAIDPWDLPTAGKHKTAVQELELTSTESFFKANVKEWDIPLTKVVPIKGFSQSVDADLIEDVKGLVSLVVVDGSHKYADVVKDIEIWYPTLMPGGHMVFHDYRHIPGPTKAVDQIAMSTMTHVGNVGWLIAFKKEA